MQEHIYHLAGGLRSWVNGSAILIAAAVCCGAVCAQTPGLRLAAPQVLSALGGPLWVKIPIDADELGEAATSARFSLGARPPNAALPFVERAEITLEKRGEKYALVIRSRDAINEPVVGIVIRDESPNGARSRVFFLLLDPPSRATAASIGQRPDVGESIPATSQPVPVARLPANAASATNIARGESVTLPRIKPKKLAFTVPAFSADSPRLKLSFGENLHKRQPTSEAERAELRMRRFTLDMDDMTADLLERENRTIQLEKQLTSLTARINAAERTIGTATPGAAAPSSTSPDVVAPAPTRVPVARTATVAPVQDQAELLWRWWVTGAGLLAVLIAAIWSFLALLRARDQANRLSTPTTKDYFAEAFPREARRETPTPDAPRPKSAQTATVGEKIENKDSSSPEIQFELPELSLAAQEAIQHRPSSNDSVSSPTLNAVDIPVDSAAAQRLRSLLPQYEDIARLTPRLDSPRRLLEQAATLCDHGETDFAIRLLAFSAYSQPATPEYWLALLELVYLEKLSREYLFNAAMFYQFHPKSIHWDEVIRIGYLLSPKEPLFATAATWSHDAPPIGTWLPFYPLKTTVETLTARS